MKCVYCVVYEHLLDIPKQQTCMKRAYCVVYEHL